MTALCQLASDWLGTIPTGGLMCERKWDGWRCLRFRGIDGKARLWSRNGMPLEGASAIARRLDAIEEAAGCRLFLDGEVVVDSTLAATKAYFEGGWRRGEERGVLHLFDVMPEAEWRAGGTDMPLHERKTWLEHLVKASEPEDDGWSWAAGSKGATTPTVVRVVPDEWAFTESDVLDIVNRVWAIGGEGLMLKAAEAPYRRNRNPSWWKVKQDNAYKWRHAA